MTFEPIRQKAGAIEKGPYVFLLKGSKLKNIHISNSILKKGGITGERSIRYD